MTYRKFDKERNSLIYTKFFATMSNKLLSKFCQTQAKTLGLLVHANNLDGVAAEKFPLPLKVFELAKEMSFNIFLNTSNDFPDGFILDIDLEYPNCFHKVHEDFPLAPTKTNLTMSCSLISSSLF